MFFSYKLINFTDFLIFSHPNFLLNIVKVKQDIKDRWTKVAKDETDAVRKAKKKEVVIF